MGVAGYAVLLLFALPFWVVGVWLILRQRQLAAGRTKRLLARIGVPITGSTGSEHQKVMPLVQALELRLHQAGLAGPGNRIKQWGVAGAITVGLLGILMAAMFGPRVALVAAAVTAAGPFYVFRQIMVRRRRFSEQFPDALEAMVRSLQAGMGVDAAMRLVAEEFPSPLADEFRRINRQVQLGVPLSGALRDFQRRVGIPEGQYFAAAMIVQRETGGRLAEILDQLAGIMRRRALFQGKLMALTAESRFTGWFIGGAPIAYIGWKYLFDRPSMVFFLEDPTGQSMLSYSVGLILVGALLLRQMMRIRF